MIEDIIKAMTLEEKVDALAYVKARIELEVRRIEVKKVMEEMLKDAGEDI